MTTTYRDTTLALLRALARGSTMAELVEALGISERTIRYHLRRLEQDGVAIVRPSGGWGGPGVYRLRDERLAEALTGSTSPPPPPSTPSPRGGSARARARPRG